MGGRVPLPHPGARGAGASGGGKEKDAIIQLAQVSLRKLEAIMEAGAKETAPSQEEIEALRAEQPIKLKVHLFYY